MKKLLLFSVLAILLSCKKDKTPNADQLIGKWEYRGSGCYCAPVKDPSAVSPGNGNIIIFTANTYQHFKKDTLIKSGTYRTRKYDNTRNQIMYDNETSSTDIVFFRIENKKLTFYGTVPLSSDGLEDYFERQ